VLALLISLSLLVRNSVSKSECGSLVGPNAGNALKQTLHGHRSRLATFDDRLNDVGRQIAEPQDPADMGLVELELSGDLGRVSIFVAAKIPHP
jgi:hypothetical protein